MLRTLARVGIALMLAASARAQSAPPFPYAGRDPLHAPGSEVTISLLTMGRGSEIWEMFGHSAIWIHDDRMGTDTVFNWGVFNMREPGFLARFLKGYMLYEMGGDSMRQVLFAYQYWRRDVVSQELNLTTAQKDSLLHIIQVNAQPENLKYRYDYFVDNCSTRPRDILDRVLGGQLRVGADSVTTHSYRWHATRLMQENGPIVLGVDIGLGEPADRPVTRWEEMFLPKELHDWVATRKVRDSTGAVVPLVRSERVLYKADRPPEPTSPPTFAWLWIVGAVVAGVLGWLASRRARGHGWRRTAATAASVWAVACGILGLLLTLLWTVTDHRFAHANENLLFFNPLWLILAVTLPMTILRGRARGVTFRLLVVLAGLGLVALLAHAVGLSRQVNLPVIGLGLLPTLALLYALRRPQPPTNGIATA